MGQKEITKEIRKYFEMNKNKNSKKTSGMPLKKCLGCIYRYKLHERRRKTSNQQLSTLRT